MVVIHYTRLAFNMLRLFIDLVNNERHFVFFCRGTTQLDDAEVIALYDGTHVPLADMNTFYGTVSSYSIKHL